MEPGIEINALTTAVIGAAIEVHRELGPGYLESVYEDALSVEFEVRRLMVERQRSFSLTYKNKRVGEGRIDFLVDRCVVVEIKAVEKLLPIHKAQVMSYLKAMRCSIGLLINFNERMLASGIRRIIWSNVTVEV